MYVNMHNRLNSAFVNYSLDFMCQKLRILMISFVGPSWHRKYIVFNMHVKKDWLPTVLSFFFIKESKSEAHLNILMTVNRVKIQLRIFISIIRYSCIIISIPKNRGRPVTSTIDPNVPRNIIRKEWARQSFIQINYKSADKIGSNTYWPPPE